MFRGDEIQKIGPKKYRIVRGEFTTCVQPTPRWEMQSRHDHDEPRRLRAAEERDLPGEERADDVPADFLLPDPGGQPRDRLPDADLRSRRRRAGSRSATRSSGRSPAARTRRSITTGSRRPGRASAASTATSCGPGSAGNSRFSMLNEHETTYVQPGRRRTCTPASAVTRSRGDMIQRLPLQSPRAGQRRLLLQHRLPAALPAGHLRRDQAHAALRRQRQRQLGPVLIQRDGATGTTTSRAPRAYTTTGSLPRITFTRGERKIGSSPLYFGVSSEYVNASRGARRRTRWRRSDQGLSRVDVNPTLRIPFTRWPFLTFNSIVQLARHLLDRKPRHAQNVQVAGTDRPARTSTFRPASPARCSTASGTRRTTATRRSSSTSSSRRSRSSARRRSTTSTRSSSSMAPTTSSAARGCNYGVANRLYAKTQTSARDPERHDLAELLHRPDAAQYDRRLPERLQHGPRRPISRRSSLHRPRRADRRFRASSAPSGIRRRTRCERWQ